MRIRTDRNFDQEFRNQEIIKTSVFLFVICLLIGVAIAINWDWISLLNRPMQKDVPMRVHQALFKNGSYEFVNGVHFTMFHASNATIHSSRGCLKFE